MAVNTLPAQTLLATVLPLLAGVIVAAFAVTYYRKTTSPPGADATYADLQRPYLLTCVVSAVGLILFGALQTRTNSDSTLAAMIGFAVFAPWTVFAVNFVGRGHLLTRRRTYAGVLVIAVLVAVQLFNAIGILGTDPASIPVVSLVSSLLALGILAVVFSVSGLVLLSAYRHREITAAHGVVALLPVLEVITAVQLTRPSAPLLNDLILSGMSVVVAGTLVMAPIRYDILRLRPGVGTTGERAAVREIDEAIITIHRDGTVARVNDTADELFGSRLTEEPLSDILGCAVADLADKQTVRCWTEHGRRQFDPRVTDLTNQYNEVFGHSVILIDVTDRNIRRQRIAVHNRILRHNIRNSLDVIKARAETIADGTHAAEILETTDALDRLSADARRIERLLRRPPEDRTATPLDTVVRSVVDSVADEYPSAAVSVDLSGSGQSITVDAELCRFALRNVVENAVVHNEGQEARVVVRETATDTGVRLVVADDGPGIPASERSVIEGEAETQQSHASSLGLWGANWAVRQLGGELSFGDSALGGAAVLIELPDTGGSETQDPHHRV